jgi:hypothetical protein
MARRRPVTGIWKLRMDRRKEGGPDLADISESFAPEYHPSEIYEIAERLYARAK